VMAHIMPIRKSIPHRTIFNLLGPLTNPAGARKYLLGVFDKSFVPKMAEALRDLGAERAIVVSSEDGMDEISLSAPTYAAWIEGEKIEYFTIKPEDVGLARCAFEDLAGGDAKENAKITEEILRGGLGGPKRDMVLLNAAAALMADGKTKNLEEGIEMAAEAIDSGAAGEKLDQIIATSKELASGR